MSFVCMCSFTLRVPGHFTDDTQKKKKIISLIRKTIGVGKAAEVRTSIWKDYDARISTKRQTNRFGILRRQNDRPTPSEKMPADWLFILSVKEVIKCFLKHREGESGSFYLLGSLIALFVVNVACTMSFSHFLQSCFLIFFFLFFYILLIYPLSRTLCVRLCIVCNVDVILMWRTIQHSHLLPFSLRSMRFVCPSFCVRNVCVGCR